MVLAIFIPQIGAYSETFLHNHIKHFSPDVVLVTTKICNDWNVGDIPVLVLDHSEMAPRCSEKAERQICEFLQQNDVTHILIEFVNMFSGVAELNARVLHLPIIHHFHGYDASQMLKNERTVEFYRWASNYSNKLIAVSEVMKRRLIAYGLSSENIVVNNYGVDKKSLRPWKDRDDDTCRFIYIGRFVSKKAPLKLLEAFSLAYDKNKNIELIMIGDTTEYHAKDNLLEKSMNFVKDNGLEGAVTFTGSLPHESVMKELSESDVYIQHSIKCPVTGDSEGLPNSILEASLCGIPVIATRHEGIPEAIYHGENGYLVDENDVESMGNYILELAGDKNKRIAMGQKSLEMNSERFDLTTSLNRLQSIIEAEKWNMTDPDAKAAFEGYGKGSNISAEHKRIKQIIAENWDSIFVIYGAGYGLNLYWNFLCSTGFMDKVSYIIDDSIDEVMGRKVISLDEFLTANSTTNVVFMISAVSKETFEIMSNKINSLDSISAVVHPLPSHLI